MIFGAAPSAPLMLIFSARRLRRRGGSFFRRGAFGAAGTQQFAGAAPSAPPIVGFPTTSNGRYGSVLSCGHFPAAVTIHCSDALRHGVTPRCSPALCSACPVNAEGRITCVWMGSINRCEMPTAGRADLHPSAHRVRRAESELPKVAVHATA